MQNLLNYLRLIRIVNCLLAAVGVWVGAYLTWVEPEWLFPALASAAAFLICAGGNVVNDIIDRDLDRIIHPERVLVTGVITVERARTVAIALNVVGIIPALFISLWLTGLSLLTIALLLVYNTHLKRYPMIGNVVVALLAGATFLVGGLSVNTTLALALPGPLIAAIYAFLFHLVRELIKDVQDLDGDRQAGFRTLPMIVGESVSILLALGMFAVLSVLTYIPVWYGWFGRTYEVITVYVVDLPTLLLLILLWGNPSANMLRLTSHALKLGMLLGLAALVFT